MRLYTFIIPQMWITKKNMIIQIKMEIEEFQDQE